MACTGCDCCKGACCCGTTCTQTTCKACEDVGGIFQGAKTSCLGAPCASVPTGACCVGTTCTIKSQCECWAAGGTYKGDGTSCSPNPCNVTTKALCTLKLNIQYGPYSLCGCPAGMTLSGTPAAATPSGYYPPGCPSPQSWTCVQTKCVDVCNYQPTGTNCYDWLSYDKKAYNQTFPYNAGPPYGTVYCPCVGTYEATCDPAGCASGSSVSLAQSSRDASYVPTANDLAALTLTEQAPQDGPGTELKSLLKLIGVEATPGCSCNARAAYMNLRGCDWCEANLDEILAWLREEANSRGLPFFQYGAKLMVLRAIKLARKKERKNER